MGNERNDSETPVAEHAGVCPNGHDVPPWRATCGVCDLAPVADPSGRPGGTSAPSDGSRSVSKVVWVVLAALAIGAIAIPLMRHNVVLIEDDFTTPEVLRTWSDDGATLTYVDDAYRVSVLADDGGTSAFHELPRTVGGVIIQVNAEANRRDATVVLDCVSDVEDVQGPGDGSATSVQYVAGYSFVLLPNDRYAILRMDEGLSSGEIRWDGGGVITAGCVVDGSGTRTLTLQVDGGKPVEVTDPDGLDTFMGVSLGAYSKSHGAAVTYDDLKVDEAT